MQHPNARIRRDAGAFFASPHFDRIAALVQLDADAITLIREAARQRAMGREVPVSSRVREPFHNNSLPKEWSRPPARSRLRGPFPSAPPRTACASFPCARLSSDLCRSTLSCWPLCMDGFMTAST
ncbi:MAG: hypothetical protein U1F76_23560 [Candidatus Competibacteraceae bacterium]